MAIIQAFGCIMQASYEYFNSDLLSADYNAALELIKNEKLIIDTLHLPLIEAAMNGEFTALCELAKAFTDGNITGIPRNYKMARFYNDTIMEINRKENSPKVLVESYRNSGLLERNFGNLEKATQEFVTAIKIMCNEINPAEWDYDIQYYLWQITAAKQNRDQV